MNHRPRATVLIALILGSGGNPAASGADLAAWGRSFVDETLRIDYHHGGDATHETIAWDRAIRQGAWAGSRVNLVDPAAVGRSRVEVSDDESGAVVFARRFDTLFAEYRTTTPALRGEARVYHESVLVPLPRRPVRIRLSVRDRDDAERVLLDRRLDPADPASIAAEAPRGDVLVVASHRGGDPHATVDVTIVGEGYTRAEEAKFRADLDRFTATLLATEPYRSARDRFNVTGAWLPSRESGADEPARGVWRDTAVGARFDSLGSERYLLTEDNRDLRAIAGQAPYDALLVMVNSPRYGGGGIYNLFCTFTTDNEWSAYVMLHEFGHSFAALADEYYSSNVAYTDFHPRGTEPREPNITALLDPKALKWADLATPGTPIPTPWPKGEFDAAEDAFQRRREGQNAAITAAVTAHRPPAEVDRLRAEADRATRDHAAAVDQRIKASPLSGVVGAFEGAGYSATGLYRPGLDCIMFSRGAKPYCPVCHRAITRTIARHGE